MHKKRIVVTGMGLITPIGDNLNLFFNNLIAGKSGIKKLQTIDTSQIDAKIGGDIGDYDYKARIENYKETIPFDMYKRLRKIAKTAPFATRLTMIAALDAFINAGLLNYNYNPHRISIFIGGHNFHNQYIEKNVIQFLTEPDYIDGLLGISMFDPDVAACIADLLQIYGPMSTVGGTCSSAGIAIKNAINEIRYNDSDLAIIGGGVLEFSRVGSHALALMQALSYKNFNDQPEKASRPFDTRREGFVPSHGTGILVIEDLEYAKNRGAKIYAEILEVESNNNGNHFTAPSADNQAYIINKVLEKAKVNPEQIDYINAHATSTPVGDITEINSIKKVFGSHAQKLKINATKSIIGHTGWTSHSIELIASILEMNHSKLHPSINIDQLDPQIDLDVCQNQSFDYEINYFIKNSFGFGGINCCTLATKYSG